MQVLINFVSFLPQSGQPLDLQFANSSAKYLQVCRKAALALSSCQTQLLACTDARGCLYTDYQLLDVSTIPQF
jgi:hypothetical protein